MTQEIQECVHHWKIESPSGSTAHGRCKFCGAERDFDNGYFFEKIGKHKVHESSVASGIRSILGPNRVEEAYQE